MVVLAMYFFGLLCTTRTIRTISRWSLKNIPY